MAPSSIQPNDYLQQGRLPFNHAKPSPSGSAPTWNAAALLNPKGFAATAPPRKMASPAPANRTPQPNHAVAHQGQIAFQFSSPNDSLQPQPDDLAPGGAASDVSATGEPRTASGGMSLMLERKYNLQDRSSIPEPKRRKIKEDEEEADESKKPFHTSGGGILGDHIREMKVEGDVKPLMKRAETVDLTSDGDAGGEDEEVVIIEPMKEREVCYGMIHEASVSCHRVPAPKPGLQALGGPAFWPLVKVVLRRKVGDTTKTIQVYDHTREVFGNVDQKTAGALAPLLDIPPLHLRTDARIPSRRKLPEEIPGQPISQSYKVDIILYGPFKYAKAVGKSLASQHVTLVSPPRVDAGIRLVNPHSKVPPQALSGSKERNSTPDPGPNSGPAPVTKSAEEIRSEVMGVFDSMVKSEDLPELEPDAKVLTPLLKHQKQALYFMTNREKPQADPEGSKLSSSIWKKKVGTGGQTFYYNILTGDAERHLPPDTLGGILADMMGLGKTLSILSLISSSMSEAEEWANRPPAQPRDSGKKRPGSGPSRSYDLPIAGGPTLDLTLLTRNTRGTLLVCPLSTITNWEEQIKQHLRPGSLSYHIYHGPNRIKDVARLCTYDLVITTYGSVSSELTSRKKRKNGQHPLEEIGWFRIVLDEAHMIREQSTLQFKAICRLQANRRWAVTGTPVQNRLHDLGSLLAFLRLKPFDDTRKFVQHIVTPFKAANPEIVPKLRVLVDTITLRRMKDKIDLPRRYDHIVFLEFSHDEQRIYNMFAKNAKDRVRVLTNQRERLLGGKTYIHILQAILRLRLICAHGKDLLNDEDFQLLQGETADSAIDLDSDDDEEGAATLSEDKAYRMFNLLAETGGDSCINCKRKLGANDAADIESDREEDILGYMTPCYHVYCRACVSLFRDVDRNLSHTSQMAGVCPICDANVRFSCVELRHARADALHEALASGRVKASSSGKVLRVDGYTGPHTKTQALIQDLQKNKEENMRNPDAQPIKSVVFSGWTSHLDLIQLALDNAGIKYVRLDGKMSRLARAHAMDAFREKRSVEVILVSIMAGGLGLNLTAGSKVYVMEPQFNPAAEAQAIDRVHRLGQKREVHTVRYIMRDSFEESMLDLQNKKMKLASLSMDRSELRTMDRVEAAKQRLMDLQSLFK